MSLDFRPFHIETKTYTSLCNAKKPVELDHSLPYDWPAREFPDWACKRCIKIWRIIMRSRRTQWSKERIALLPKQTRELIDSL